MCSARGESPPQDLQLAVRNVSGGFEATEPELPADELCCTAAVLLAEWRARAAAMAAAAAGAAGGAAGCATVAVTCSSCPEVVLPIPHMHAQHAHARVHVHAHVRMRIYNREQQHTRLGSVQSK